jgi:drug/metabolite transporter (DMT)-like permease
VTAPGTLLPTLAMLAAVLMWSSATPGSKFALTELGVTEFVVLRLSLAALALWLIVLAMRANAGLRTVGWRPLVMGLLEPGLVTFLVSIGLTMTSPVSGSVFWGLTPLIMPLLGRVVLGERIEGVVLVAAIIAFGGTLVLVWGQTHHGGGSLLGDLFVASGVLASAVNALIARRNAQAGANPLVTASWQLTSACCVAALLFLVMPQSDLRATEASAQTIGVLLYLGLVVSVGVYILSNYAVRHLPVGRMSLLGCLTAPLGTILSATFLGTHVSALDLAAVGLVILAVALPALVRRQSPVPS